MFEHIQPYAGDPIFAVVNAFHADPRPHKVNLSIGIYFDEQGALPVLPSGPGASELSHRYSGCAPLPLTSTLAIIGKLTP